MTKLRIECTRDIYVYALANACLIREWVARGIVAPKGESPYKSQRFGLSRVAKDKRHLQQIITESNVSQSGGGDAET